jgi:hypothetical protein
MIAKITSKRLSSESGDLRILGLESTKIICEEFSRNAEKKELIAFF